MDDLIMRALLDRVREHPDFRPLHNLDERLDELLRSYRLIGSGWLAVFYTDDGPSVEGPFATNEEALAHVLNDYGEKYGETPEAARERYETSGDEWVTRLHAPDE